MKLRKLKPRPKPLLTRKIPRAYAPYQDFWLFREGERAYNDYWDLLGRNDPSVRLPLDIYCSLPKELDTIPSITPGKRDNTPGIGLNLFGPPTIINQTGGDAFGIMCHKVAEEWAQGPGPLIVTTRTIRIPNGNKPSKLYRFKVKRVPLVQNMETLADWGKKAATGEFFILHLGV